MMDSKTIFSFRMTRMIFEEEEGENERNGGVGGVGTSFGQNEEGEGEREGEGSDSEDSFVDAMMAEEANNPFPQPGFSGEVGTYSTEGDHFVSNVRRNMHRVDGNGIDGEEETTILVYPRQNPDDGMEVETESSRMSDVMGFQGDEEGYNSEDERSILALTQRLNVSTVEELVSSTVESGKSGMGMVERMERKGIRKMVEGLSFTLR
eukprot:TRINITY_DN973_c0_g2_i2.p1 TRINITY_DN973_c0_g2~~TRINITY_DN973_c0_g2_i2.p1  ORF type:complete len:207 (+),score=66.39 TRINITY_DN973_c0_g2_i2:124-744(+)